MMGLSTPMYWISWFVKCLIYLLIKIIIFTSIFILYFTGSHEDDGSEHTNVLDPLVCQVSHLSAHHDHYLHPLYLSSLSQEAMKMMGLSTPMYWISWFVKCLIYLLITIIIFTILFSIPIGEKGKVLNYSQPTLFLFFLLCYIIATIAFCFMISTFFNKGKNVYFI